MRAEFEIIGEFAFHFRAKSVEFDRRRGERPLLSFALHLFCVHSIRFDALTYLVYREGIRRAFRAVNAAWLS